MDEEQAKLIEALRDAFQHGISEADLMAILADMRNVRADEPPSTAPGPGTGPPDSELRDGVRIYTEVPEGMITAPQAARKYGLSRHTIQAWVIRGRIPMEGKLRGSARGGGFILLDEDKLVALIAYPPKRGGRRPGARC